MVINLELQWIDSVNFRHSVRINSNDRKYLSVETAVTKFYQLSSLQHIHLFFANSTTWKSVTSILENWVSGEGSLLGYRLLLPAVSLPFLVHAWSLLLYEDLNVIELEISIYDLIYPETVSKRRVFK